MIADIADKTGNNPGKQVSRSCGFYQHCAYTGTDYRRGIHVADSIISLAVSHREILERAAHFENSLNTWWPVTVERVRLAGIGIWLVHRHPKISRVAELGGDIRGVAGKIIRKLRVRYAALITQPERQ